ncbi:hypothetical protein [Pseudonocardia kunmingensis]|uniref:Uncharacterized protein n=1 Tax=Pseudonocardia kunmingensis TaxID=630975 RepID=A0A543DKX6_9PSEU|nr:hypothetical protein [Pseudonocardia kunmingensis]TQM09990.1 hypothetical protein FB558_5769 [Pseudonocardia kunmingensis]
MTCTVLVADDDRAIRESLARVGGPATVVRSGVLVGIAYLAGDRFSEHLTARPWLLAGLRSE